MQGFFKSIRKADLASVREHLAAAPALLSSTCEPPPKKDAGQSPLQVSLKARAFEVSDLLIDAGADVNFMESEAASEWRAPVLHDAITACFFSTDAERPLVIVRKMLERGADANCRDSYGNSSLDRAMLDIKQCSPTKAAIGVPVLIELLGCRADPYASGTDRQSVDRFYRGDEAYGMLVRALGSTEAWQGQVWQNDPTGLTGEENLDQQGRTPLMTAAICGSLKVLLHLLRAGADPNRCDSAGWSALGLARWSFPISELLLEYGADPNQPQGDTGLTAFSRAFYELRLAELMLRFGADRATRNTQGKTFAEAQEGR